MNGNSPFLKSYVIFLMRKYWFDYLSTFLAVAIGCLTVVLVFAVSFMKSNMMTVSNSSICIFTNNYFFSKMIIQIFGAFAAPMLGIYLLGLFSSRVKSRVIFWPDKCAIWEIIRIECFGCLFSCANISNFYTYWIDRYTQTNE